MALQWKNVLEGLQQNPGRADLVSGVICVCKTLPSPSDQAGLLTECASIILKEQPVLALHMLRLSLLLSPRDRRALTLAREIFKRRGRAAAEQRVAELLATLTQATAVSPTETQGMIFAPKTASSQELDKSTFVKSTPVKRSESLHFGIASEPSLSIKVASSPDNTSSSTNPPPEDLFQKFLEECQLDLQWKKLSVGFINNNAGLVAFVNLLFTMMKIDEGDRSNFTIILFRMIKDRPDESGGEDVFDKLFMQPLTRRDGT